MGSIIRVEFFPGLKLRIWIDLIRGSQQLLKFFLIRSVGALYLKTKAVGGNG
jgi:hypothetical protein